MPELPEVETVRMQLRQHIVGKTISRVEVFNDKSVSGSEYIEDVLVGKTVADIGRIGKLMIFSFAGEDNLFLLAHLKMTGHLFFVDKAEVTGGGHSMTASDVSEFPGRHTRVAFTFSDSTNLYFNDMRKFGYLRVVDAVGLAAARSRFGPEPIAISFDKEVFSQKLRSKQTVVKAALLNQQFVAGLGNIYVDEALWRAQVLPTRKSSSLSKQEAISLAEAASQVLKEAIAVGGTTFQHFLDTEGSKGNFSQYLKVFGRQGQKCSRCGTVIEKIRCAGRGTHYCPECQK